MTKRDDPRFFARSASDRTDDWPFWYIADRSRGSLNVTIQLVPEMRGYMPFLPRYVAEYVAQQANAGRNVCRLSEMEG